MVQGQETRKDLLLDIRVLDTEDGIDLAAIVAIRLQLLPPVLRATIGCRRRTMQRRMGELASRK